MTTITAVPNAAPHSSSASARAYASLVLGILGLIVCTPLSPLAWYLGWAERRDIRAGTESPAGDEIATAGMVLGMVGTALMALVVLAVVVVGVVVLGIIAIAR